MAAPIAVAIHEEPEPDAAVMTRTVADYMRLGTPLPQDVRLAVEVSVSTLRTDLTDKAMIYSSVGIPDCWVINVNARTLEVFRRPTPDGYVEHHTITETGSLSPLAAPDAPIVVADLLP